MENTERPDRRGNAHDDIEFLVSSWNRLDILNEIASAPKTRNDLKDRTDGACVTLSRILADPGNIDRAQSGHPATPYKGNRARSQRPIRAHNNRFH